MKFAVLLDDRTRKHCNMSEPQSLKGAEDMEPRDQSGVRRQRRESRTGVGPASGPHFPFLASLSAGDGSIFLSEIVVY